jgi:hypothetical protein
MNRFTGIQLLSWLQSARVKLNLSIENQFLNPVFQPVWVVKVPPPQKEKIP